MKQIVCLVCAVWMIKVSAFAQPTSLCIATDKTMSLVFPFSIKHVDRGTKDILVEPLKEAGNILLVKAATKDFSETNLSVVTEDGSVYCFLVGYGIPASWVNRLPIQSKTALSTYANSIVDNPSTMKGVRDEKWDMLGQLKGIYIKDDVIYYQLELTNESPIDYDVDFLRFYIRDKKKSKRTAAQEIELTPLYIAGNTSKVKANSKCVMVMALEKFTVPDAKYLAIEIGEKNGGRNLLMKVNNRKIIKAIPLPDLR